MQLFYNLHDLLAVPNVNRKEDNVWIRFKNSPDNFLDRLLGKKIQKSDLFTQFFWKGSSETTCRQGNSLRGAAHMESTEENVHKFTAVLNFIG